MKSKLMLDTRAVKKFQKLIWDFYKSEGRKFPWRETRDPYQILVSEIMLQQTQTQRVAEKYPIFLEQFPTFRDLAKAQFSEVLKLWQGLGYNRRALNLKKTAEVVDRDFAGKLPLELETLRSLPGIGAYTAAAVAAFAGNHPTVLIETNVRTVFLHSFYADQAAEIKISDADLLVLVEKTLDRNNPREWYYALMDYGVALKKKFPKINVRSTQYRKQSKFKGSLRQMRGEILRQVSNKNGVTLTSLIKLLAVDLRFEPALNALLKENLLVKKRNRILIP